MFHRDRRPRRGRYDTPTAAPNAGSPATTSTCGCQAQAGIRRCWPASLPGQDLVQRARVGQTAGVPRWACLTGNCPTGSPPARTPPCCSGSATGSAPAVPGLRPALAGAAAAAIRPRRPGRRLLVGHVDGPGRGRPDHPSPSPAMPARSSKPWPPTTSTSAAPTPWRSSSTGRSAASPRASSTPPSTAAPTAWSSTPSTSTPGSSSTSKTAGPCGSRPSSTHPPKRTGSSQRVHGGA